MDRLARKQRIEDYIAKWQTKLRLQDWWVYFAEDEEPESGMLADANIDLDGLCSTLRFSSRLLESEDEVSVIHELLEILLKRLRSYIPASDEKDADVERHRIIQRLIWAFLEKHDYEPIKFAVRRR